MRDNVIAFINDNANYLLEWLRCFAVYGLGMLPGLLILSALTRLLQTLLHTHAPR